MASLLGLVAMGLVGVPTHAATLTWGTSGTGGAGTWNAASNWWDGTSQQTWSNAAPDDAIFGGTGGTVALSGPITAGGITFNTFTGSYTIGTASQTLTINGGGITMNSGAGAVTIQTSPITLGAAQIWTNNSSSLLAVSSGITNGGSLLTVAGSGTTTLSGAIGGTGGITKTGAGSLTLSAANTYSGTTNANGGMLISASRGSFGTGAISIGQSGTVELRAEAPSYYANGYTNAVSGSGVLQLVAQSGASSVNYSGDLSGFTGTVSATSAGGPTYVGIGNLTNTSLNLTGSNAKFVVSGAGQLLSILNPSSSGTIAMGELSGNGNVVTRFGSNTAWQVGALSTSSTFSGSFQDNNGGVSSLVKVGSGTLTLSGNSVIATGYSGQTTVSQGVIVSSNRGSFGTGTISIGPSGIVELRALAPSYYENGYTNAVSGSGVLQLVAQSSGNSVNYSGDLSGFTGTVSATSASGQYTGIGNLATPSLNLSGSNAKFVVSGPGQLLSILNPSSSGTIALGELSGNGNVLTRFGSNTAWQVGALSTSSTFSGSFQDNNGGVSSLVKVGSGTLTLSGSSSYSGGTQLSAGVLTFGTTSALGTGTVTFGGGALQSAWSGTIANPIALSAASGTFGSQSNTNTFSGAISGAGSLFKLGSGTLTLSGSNSYSGGTTVSNGVVVGSNLNAFGSGSIAIGTAGTLQLTANNGGASGPPYSAYYASGVTNTVSGSGTLQLVGQSTNFSVNYSGDLSGFTGIVSATAAVNTWVGFGNSSTMSINTTGSNARFVVSGAGKFVGVLGATGTIAMGELSGDGTIHSNLNYATTWEIGALSTSSTFSGGIFNDTTGLNSKLSTLSKVGSGTLTLSGSSSYSGGTRLGAGTLVVANTAALGAGVVTLGGGILQSAVTGTLANAITITAASGTFDSQANANTLSGTISGAGGFVKIGSGALTLSGSNTYSGTTSANAGTLVGSNLSSFGTGPIAIGASGTVQMTALAAGYWNNGFTNTVTGSGVLSLVGSSGATSMNYSGDLSNFNGTVAVSLGSSGQVVAMGNTSNSATWTSGTNVRFVFSGAGSFYPLATAGGTFAMGELSGTGTIVNRFDNNNTLQVGSLSTSSTFTGTFQNNGAGTLAIRKVGAGALTLSGSSTYTGATTIAGGRLEIAYGGRINGTSGITINGVGAELKYNSATPLTQPITFTQGTISGTGTIGTAVTAGSGDILSPGNSPGIQAYTSGLTFDPAGTYLWEINDATSTAGTGWDLINVSGGSGLVINSTSGTTFKIAITSLSGTAAGNAANFSATTSGSWTILSSASGITGFSASKFTLDRSAFSNTSSGTFTISQVGSGSNQSLVLAYNTLSTLASSTSSVSGFRVMQSQTTTTSVNLINSGPDATGYSLSPSAALSLSSGSTGTLAASGTQAISFGYASTATTGARSGTVSYTDTGNGAAGSFTVSGAVLDNRVVTASTANFGVVHVGASGTATSTFTSAGSDNNFTRITVANGSGGGLTVSGSSGFVFDGTGGSSRTIAGTFGTAGAITGTIALTNSSAEAGGLLQGQTPGTTSVVYSAGVFSGTATWNVPGGGSWGTGASSSWTSANDVGAAPGTFAGYAATDRAIFAGSQTGTSTILLDGAMPSLAALVFSNTANRYVIDQGSGGSLTLAASSGKPTIEVAAGGLHEIKAAILGSSGLEKLGAGTLVLSGSSNFTGGTDLSAGRLAVNGSLGGPVNVASGAILGGSGQLSGLVTVAAGGILAPGNSPGTLTMSSGLVLDAASILNFELSATTFTAGGGINDLINVTGDFTLDGILNVAAISGDFSAVPDNTKWRLFNYSGGTFINGGLTLGSMPSVGSTGKYFQIDAATAGQINLVIVPEPGSLALAGIGVGIAGWMAARRSRRR